MTSNNNNNPNTSVSVPVPDSEGRGGRMRLRRARVAFRRARVFVRFVLFLALVKIVDHFYPFLGSWISDLGTLGVHVAFAAIFTLGYVMGVHHMEEVVDNPLAH